MITRSEAEQICRRYQVRLCSFTHIKNHSYVRIKAKNVFQLNASWIVNSADDLEYHITNDLCKLAVGGGTA